MAKRENLTVSQLYNAVKDAESGSEDYHYMKRGGQTLGQKKNKIFKNEEYDITYTVKPSV